MSPTIPPSLPVRPVADSGFLKQDASATAPLAVPASRGRRCSLSQRAAASDTGRALRRCASAPGKLASLAALPQPRTLAQSMAPEKAPEREAAPERKEAQEREAGPEEREAAPESAQPQGVRINLLDMMEFADPRLLSAFARMQSFLSRPQPTRSGPEAAQALPQDVLDTQQSLRSLVETHRHPMIGSVPCCGFLPAPRFLDVMLVLAEAVHKGFLPRKVIGVGSGYGFIEKCFEVMGCQVRCFDDEPSNRFIPVEQALFPKDIGRCLPEDCSDCLLLAAYPQGYLGPVLTEFTRRGGKTLCTTVEHKLFSSMHGDYEDDPALLRQAINRLGAQGSGNCFQVALKDQFALAFESYFQFYNASSGLRQLLFASPALRHACSYICLDI